MAASKKRKANFNTRKHGLQKKFNELKTLCGLTSCCLIMYDPNESQVKAYPEDPAECLRIMKRYKETSKEERLKHNDTIFDLLNEKKKKCQAELAKLCSSNGEIEYPTCDNALDNMCLEELKSVSHTVDSLLQLVQTKEEEANLQLQIVQPPSFVEPLDIQLCGDHSNSSHATAATCPLDIQDYLLLDHESEWNSDSSSDGYCFNALEGLQNEENAALDQSIDWASYLTGPLDFAPSDNDGYLVPGAGNQHNQTLEWLKQCLEIETSEMSCDMVAGSPDQLSDAYSFDVWVA